MTPGQFLQWRKKGFLYAAVFRFSVQLDNKAVQRTTPSHAKNAKILITDPQIF